MPSFKDHLTCGLFLCTMPRIANNRDQILELNLVFCNIEKATLCQILLYVHSLRDPIGSSPR